MEPKDVNNLLASIGISGPEWEASNTFFGWYVNNGLLHHLDHRYQHYQEGEMLCYKKYLHEITNENDADDNVYVFVKVQTVAKKMSPSGVMDEYEVSQDASELKTIVKAHRLYRFTREVGGVEAYLREAEEEDHGVCEDKGEGQRRREATANIGAGEDQGECEAKRVGQGVRTAKASEKLKGLVREIWAVKDIKERCHMLRRVALYWHPLRSPRLGSLCLQMVSLLQSLLDQLKGIDTTSNQHQVDKKEVPRVDAIASAAFSPPSPLYFGVIENLQSEKSASEDSEPVAKSVWCYRCPPFPTPSSDSREARVWWGHADHDLQVANECYLQHLRTCWILYMLHQAAEKYLKACLLKYNSSVTLKFFGHKLWAVTNALGLQGNQRIMNLVADIDREVSVPERLKYPSIRGSPCSMVTRGKAKRVFDLVRGLRHALNREFHVI